MVTLKVEAQGCTILAIVHPIDVMLGKVEVEHLIVLNNTTKQPKYIQATLVKTYPKMPQKIGEQSTHQDPNPTLYECDQVNDHGFIPLFNI